MVSARYSSLTHRLPPIESLLSLAQPR